MVLLTPQQRYIIKSLPTDEEPEKEINILDFYIQFGFNNRGTAENAFSSTINKLMDTEIISDDQKEYLKEVFINNNFKEVFDTNSSSNYWNVTERKVTEDNILKRKHDVSVKQLIIPERNPKDRRISANTTKNKICDLSNAGPSGQFDTAFTILKNETKTVETSVPSLPSVVEDSILKVFKKSISMDEKFNHFTKMVVQNSNDITVFFKLLAHLTETQILHPDIFVVSKLKFFSEMDLNLFLWGRIFTLLFSSSSTLKIKSSEVKLEGSTFKIGYKIGCVLKDKFVTLSCIEVGKFVEKKKVRDDRHKSLLEGKTIINNIIKQFKFIDPRSIPIIVLQICGLKGDFVEVILGKKKSYLAHRPLNRLRVPLDCNNKDTISIFLSQLLYYKEHLDNLQHNLNQMIKENDDKRSSFERILGVKQFVPPNFLNWIDETVERL